MNTRKNVSRRSFIKQSSLGLGAGMVGVSTTSAGTPGDDLNETRKLPREIRVASIDLKGLWPDTTRESRIKRILERMEAVTGMKPDLVCLPELFDTSWVEEQKPLGEFAEDEKVPGTVTGRIAAFAKKNNCYVACPLLTNKD